MNESVPERREQVIPEVERSRRELRDALDTLQVAVRHRFDPRRRIADAPLPWLVGAFLAGWWLSRPRRT